MIQGREKIYILIALVAIFFIVDATIIYVSLQRESVNAPIVDDVVVEKARVSLGEAVLTRDKLKCSELAKDYEKDVCLESIDDLGFYDQAIAQLNPEICGNIKNEERKKTCFSVATSSVQHFEEEDPQHLADVYTSSHNNDKSIEQYEELLKKDPNNFNNLLNLSLVYAEKGLKEQEQGNNQRVYVEKALQIAERAAKVKGDNPEVYRIMAYAYEIMPDYDKAIEYYDKALSVNKNDLLSLMGRAHAKNLKGLDAEAYGDYLLAAELDKEKQVGPIYANLCRLGINEKIETVIKNCELGAEKSMDPISKSESLQILASLNYPIREYDKAEAYLKKAQELTPDDANLYVGFGFFYLAKQDFTKAEESANKAMSLSPTKTKAYVCLTYSLKNQKRDEESLTAAKKALDIIDNDVSLLYSEKNRTKKEIYYMIADLYSFLGDKEKEKINKELGDVISL